MRGDWRHPACLERPLGRTAIFFPARGLYIGEHQQHVASCFRAGGRTRLRPASQSLLPLDAVMGALVNVKWHKRVWGHVSDEGLARFSPLGRPRYFSSAAQWRFAADSAQAYCCAILAHESSNEAKKRMIFDSATWYRTSTTTSRHLWRDNPRTAGRRATHIPPKGDRAVEQK